jgi:aminoglycoside phosphotransferase
MCWTGPFWAVLEYPPYGSLPNQELESCPFDSALIRPLRIAWCSQNAKKSDFGHGRQGVSAENGWERLPERSYLVNG